MYVNWAQNEIHFLFKCQGQSIAKSVSDKQNFAPEQSKQLTAVKADLRMKL